MSGSRSSIVRLWAQAGIAGVALAIGSLALFGTAVGIATAYARYGGADGGDARALSLGAIMLGSSLLTMTFGVGLGLGVATALEARSRAIARRASDDGPPAK